MKREIKVILKRSRAIAKKIDARKTLLDLGFDETEGSRHTEYTLYDQDTGNQIAYTAISRSNKIDFLKSDELKGLRKALKIIDREDLYFDLIGAPKKKKKKKVIEKVPFFSAWAEGVESALKGLTFDRFTTNIDDALYNLFAEDALRDDPTLSFEGFREELGHLINLISNNKNNYISKLRTGDILSAIRLADPFSEGEASVEDILEMLGEAPGLTVDVEQHIEKLQGKGLAISGDDIVLTEEGIEASASFVFSHKLLKLSRWMRNSGFRKEAILILNLGRSECGR